MTVQVCPTAFRSPFSKESGFFVFGHWSVVISLWFLVIGQWLLENCILDK